MLDGRIRLVELVATGDEDRQAFTDSDLRMLASVGGRERTREGFAALADAAGLTITSIAPAEWGFSLIDCTVR